MLKKSLFAKRAPRFRRKLFNKVFLVFLLIEIAFSLTLFAILAHNLITIKTEQASDMSEQILATVGAFLHKKLNAVDSVQQHLAGNAATWNQLLRHIKAPYAGTSAEVVERGQSLHQSVFQAARAADGQVNGVYLYCADTQHVVQCGGTLTAAEDAGFRLLSASALRAPERLPMLYAVRQKDNHTNSFSFFVVNAAYDIDALSAPIASFAIRFDAMNIRQSYRYFDAYLKGAIYLLDGAGEELLFDSSGEYTAEPAKLMADAGQRSSFVWYGGSLTRRLGSAADGFILLNVIPGGLIAEDVNVVARSIFSVLTLTMLLSFLLAFLSTRLFSRRLYVIEDVIGQLRQGRFPVREDRLSHGDELGLIYDELITMSEAIDRHIQKEYGYELRQKRMELYALQAQIDPHFLYNSLEVIRMNLVIKNDPESARMVRLLAELFRSAMKKDAVVTVRDEWTYVESYLELYRLRFGDRLRYEMEAEAEVLRWGIIKHVLQPIVENVIVHGFTDQAESGLVRIKAWREREEICFSVWDNGRGIASERLEALRCQLSQPPALQDSVGILNVNSRLRIIYGDDYRLTLDSAEGEWTHVCFRVRAMTRKDLESYVQSFDRR